MRTTTKTWTTLILAGAFALTACNGDDSGDSDASATSTMTSPTTTTTTSTSTDPTTTTTTTDPTTDPTTTTTDPTTGETETTGGDPFVFDETPADQLTKVDRMGMPAINTAVITSKDDYNAASPADDANGDFVAEIVANIEGFHMALDGELMGAGLTPCPTMECVEVAAPFVVPDTLKIDLAGTAGFPNGRKLADPVMDVTLALVLLDIKNGTHGVTTLAELPLNPPANDKAFLGDFPYLADPH